MTDPIRVLIAEDQALLRDSFRILLDTTPGFVVVGEAGTGRETVELALARRPHVVLMDISMPDMTGIDATAEICRRTSGTRVLILTTFDLDEYIYGALRAGASGFLLKDTTAADLVTAIRVVADGEALLAPSVTRRLIAAFGAQPRPSRAFHRRLDGITDRERETLMLIARGLSNADIAAHLSLSPATVKSHVGRLLTKLNARDRAQLVVVAYETGLVTAAPDGF
ncbi:DNA-binding response regulator [Actinoplanes philippinensis]|uniref:DNA-binding response regulator, NarL/FixJ family, contains REC and HTH domains n=1 Tax=Actinoplanes philippinensis TaxID=35752 RepID=A0A1I2MP95_9ACTN|nr:response regulator transcription factor [Actinoplanes philippinensis]GIE82813.1 DNA-binding response regulator [Actinoplanes philippinensis]SFF91186.1 DNA-binding response regulator, NarL/FixJ family, contains REC and HTH domains [Actinoplanes philippinensis]